MPKNVMQTYCKSVVANTLFFHEKVSLIQNVFLFYCSFVLSFLSSCFSLPPSLFIPISISLCPFFSLLLPLRHCFIQPLSLLLLIHCCPTFCTLGLKQLGYDVTNLFFFHSDGVHSEDNSFTNMQPSHQTMLIHSHSNPDIMSTIYDDLRSSDYPEHVLKVYKPDQTCKYLLVHKETTAHEVVMLALQEFGITDPSSHFSLCEVSVAEGGIIKQRRLPDQLQNLAERIGLSSRWVSQISWDLFTDIV